MLHELRQFISEKQLFSQNDTLLLTVSGGIDSIVLFDLFLKAGFSFVVAHCNFGLRGEESDLDEQFVCNLAKQNGIFFHVNNFDTKSVAATESISIQMAARNLRYHWFEDLATSHKYSHIATAHQLNDVIETTLINISRGTGIAGLHGIPAKNGNIVRPLLFASRDSIKAYAEKNALEWREDRSNGEEKYARNLIRNQVVPALKKLNPNLEEVFKQNTERFNGTEQLFKFHVEQYRNQLLKKYQTGFSISILKLDQTPSPLTILAELLLPFGFNYKTIQSIYKSKEQQAGALYYSDRYTLQKDRLDWIILPSENHSDFSIELFETDTHIQLPNGTLSICTINHTDFKSFDPSNNTTYLDKSILTWPLTIRNWQHGDAFQPFGMNGVKKVSDYLTDIKIPSSLKKKTLLLVSNFQILWLIGYRSSKIGRISDSSDEIVVFTFTPLQNDC